jgi:long-chain acyl-CoA synthetase
VIEGAGGTTLEELRARGRTVAETELEDRSRRVAKADPYTFIYTSGTTGPPKGCVLSHGNYVAMLDMVTERGVVGEGPDELIYLFLPLAHAFALLLMLISADRGVTIAYWGGDSAKIIPELSEVRPTYLPSVPRIFEKLYTLVTAHADPEQIAEAIEIGTEVRRLEAIGAEIPAELRSAFEEIDERLFKNVRAAFGGRLREAVTGAAPIAKEILEFFYAAGVPVMEGYGMTETATAATGMRPGEHRFGSVGTALPGVEIRIADDGEILVKGPNVCQGYFNDEAATRELIDADGWMHSGDVGHFDDAGYLVVTDRKKDLIITAQGKNIAPREIETRLRYEPLVSQAVVIGEGRPYLTALITLDPDQLVPWARTHGKPLEPEALVWDPDLRAAIDAAVAHVNGELSRPETIRKWRILPHDFTVASGELTPTLKVKRNVVSERYADVIGELYAEPR